ncbi:MAG TPA: hypothetical protein VK361_01165 [Rubrobacteraceae bacterium]|nr:hypothetical protein [Rubrobacteraceae bacterium]
MPSRMAQLLEEGADHKLYLSCVGIVAVVAARNEGLPIDQSRRCAVLRS